MKKIISIILKFIFIGFSLFYALISFLFYIIGSESISGEVYRDKSHLIGGIIALIFAFIIFPIGINLILNIGKSRQRVKRLLCILTGKEYVTSEELINGISFDEMGTLEKADCLVYKAYMKPMSMIVGSLFFFTFLVVPIHHLFSSGLELSYIISQTVLFIIFQFPIVIILIVLNVRFYPWVKMWAMNIETLNKIFPTSEGMTKSFLISAKSIKEKYDYTPMDKYIRITSKNNGNMYELSRHYRNDSKKFEAQKEASLQIIFYTQIRNAICLGLWLFSFILGWFVLPKLVSKIKTSQDVKVIKHFYPKKTLENVQK